MNPPSLFSVPSPQENFPRGLGALSAARSRHVTLSRLEGRAYRSFECGPAACSRTTRDFHPRFTSQCATIFDLIFFFFFRLWQEIQLPPRPVSNGARGVRCLVELWKEGPRPCIYHTLSFHAAPPRTTTVVCSRAFAPDEALSALSVSRGYTALVRGLRHRNRDRGLE